MYMATFAYFDSMASQHTPRRFGRSKGCVRLVRVERIQTTVIPMSELPPAQWEEIWQLTIEFYDVEREYFERELRRRQSIAMFHVGGALLGMASVDVYSDRFRGRSLSIIATGHVLIREHARGRNLLQKLGFRIFIATRLRHPFQPIYWFFETFSYKSYLLLPRNFRDFWPRFDRLTPAGPAALIEQLATETYGPAWRPARGVVVRSGQKRLRVTAAPVILGPDADPNLTFFARSNPGHAEGDMLVCLCPLTVANWLCVARRAVQRLHRQSPH
jgi:hypothetical protein